MRPLALVAAGLVLVVLDLRVNGVDLLPDPLGWLLAAGAAASLRDRHVGFLVTAVAGGVGALVALPTVLAPGIGAPEVVVSLLQSVVLFATCTALHALVPGTGVGRVAGVLRWVDLALTVLLVAATPAGVGAGRPGDAPGALVAAALVVLALATLAAAVTFLVVLVVAARHPAPDSPGSRSA